jgi:hypothetical protein
LMIAERTTEAFNGRVAVLSSQAGSRGQSAIHSGEGSKTVMKCSDLQPDLPLYADGVLSDGSSLSIKGHLEACPLCRQRYSEYREIKLSLGRMATRRTSPSLRGEVKRSVVAELQASRRAWLPVAPDVREFLQMRVMPYGVGALASVLICGLFLAMMFSGTLRNDPLPASKAPTLLAANHNPFRSENDVSTADFVQSRLGLANESPSINPQGALVALTKTLVHSGLKNDEVVVIADVYSDGLAQIAEVVEPSRDRRAVDQLERALYSENAPFVPSSMESRPESVRVVLKFQSVDVHANTRRTKRWH